MASHQLAGSRVLIVEDEYYLADDVRSVLSDVGAEVLGPVATVSEARTLIEADPAIDGVLLDVNLRGEMAFDVADTLHSRGIPFAFVTGYDRAAIPDRFAGTARLQKPVNPQKLVDVFGSIVGSDVSNQSI
jgi:response regulator RpfG family c-di-GMP phosphodiesterase